MKKKHSSNPFKDLKLDDYEKELEESLDKGKLVSDTNFKETRKMLEEAASRHLELQETKSITLRLKKKDLIKIKAKAKRKNIPYQTLIGLLINLYVEEERKLTI